MVYHYHVICTKLAHGLYVVSKKLYKTNESIYEFRELVKSLHHRV